VFDSRSARANDQQLQAADDELAESMQCVFRQRNSMYIDVSFTHLTSFVASPSVP